MSTPREEREVVVVGGGPAGSATAAWLADAGHDVLLLDRARFPRRKPCAECVNPAGVDALRRLGVWDEVQAAGPARLDGWHIGVLGGGHSFDGCFPAAVHGIGIPRETLDHILLRNAEARGAEARTGIRVADLLRDPAGRVAGVRVQGDEGEMEIGARLVVGADGLRSVVLRRLALLRRRPRLRKLALTAHVLGFDDQARGEVHVSGRGACLGIAPVGGGLANVTVVVPEERAKEVAGDPGACFDAALECYGVGHVRRVDPVIATGPFDCPIRSAVADGALLVGDAAGYYDPFTGQGIFRALRGGELAAEAAHAALHAGDTSARGLAPYERARRAAFGPGERVQHIVEAFVSRPRLLGAVARRFTARPALGDAVIRVTGDVSPVATLFTPRFWAGLLW